MPPTLEQEIADLKIRNRTLASIADAKMVENMALKLELEYQERVIRKLQADLKTLMAYVRN